MTAYQLRLFEDRLDANAAFATPLTAANRIVYVVTGAATVGTAALTAEQAWCGADEMLLSAGPDGARVWRWDIVRPTDADLLGEGPGVASRALAVGNFAVEADGQYLMRCDSVAFPPGGVAYSHTHQGPGIRCLHHGSIRIETEGKVFSVAPGEAWFESGPSPVFAAASQSEPTGFVRVMVLPRSLQGKSSIRYVRDEDRDKPKTQQYKVFVEEFIEI